jgi:hypothetical protein
LQDVIQFAGRISKLVKDHSLQIISTRAERCYVNIHFYNSLFLLAQFTRFQHIKLVWLNDLTVWSMKFFFRQPVINATKTLDVALRMSKMNTHYFCNHIANWLHVFSEFNDTDSNYYPGKRLVMHSYCLKRFTHTLWSNLIKVIL